MTREECACFIVILGLMRVAEKPSRAVNYYYCLCVVAVVPVKASTEGRRRRKFTL